MFEAVIIIIYIHFPVQDFTIGFFQDEDKCNEIVNKIVNDININDEAGVIQNCITTGCYNILGI
tara:strand:- start:224 stop:415 length:192 start_codon:yes stop_codon:yes gene_type:complete